MTQGRPFIVGIGGTNRPGSSSERALRLALTHAATVGAEIAVFCGEALDLPLYDPESEMRSPAARELERELRRADAVIISSPCYHGAISGRLKNALDYIEDLRDDQRPYLDGRAVGCIACGHGVQGPGMLLMGLRGIVHTLRGWPTPMGVAINGLAVRFADGEASDPAIDRQLRIMADQVVEFAVRTPREGVHAAATDTRRAG